MTLVDFEKLKRVRADAYYVNKLCVEKYGRKNFPNQSISKKVSPTQLFGQLFHFYIEK